MSWIIRVSVGLILIAALVLLILHERQLPASIVPISWNSTLCADCRMHVSDRRFAAQLQTLDGRVLNFDDPTCLLHYLKTRKPPVHAVYFHHLYEDHWLSLAEVGFIPFQSTPMGYNQGAVARGTASAIAFEAALAKTPR
jgi:hypothetical protein